MNPVLYSGAGLTKVQPPVVHDATAGFILSRALEQHGRPVSFVFVGSPPAPDGSRLELDVALLRKSLNYASLLARRCLPPVLRHALRRPALRVDHGRTHRTRPPPWRVGRRPLRARADRQRPGRARARRRGVPQALPAPDRVPAPAGRPRGAVPAVAGGQARAGARPPDRQLHALRQRAGGRPQHRAPRPPPRAARLRQREDDEPRRRTLARRPGRRYGRRLGHPGGEAARCTTT